MLLALRELDREHAESAFDASEVATRAGLVIGVTERELEYLERLGAATAEGDGELDFEPTTLPIEEAGRRHDTLRELDTEEREALLNAIERGDVDPADALYDIDDAVDAAERALGAT